MPQMPPDCVHGLLDWAAWVQHHEPLGHPVRALRGCAPTGQTAQPLTVGTHVSPTLSQVETTLSTGPSTEAPASVLAVVGGPPSFFVPPAPAPPMPELPPALLPPDATPPVTTTVPPWTLVAAVAPDPIPPLPGTVVGFVLPSEDCGASDEPPCAIVPADPEVPPALERFFPAPPLQAARCAHRTSRARAFRFPRPHRMVIGSFLVPSHHRLHLPLASRLVPAGQKQVRCERISREAESWVSMMNLVGGFIHLVTAHAREFQGHSLMAHAARRPSESARSFIRT